MKKWILFAAVLIHIVFLASLFVDLIDPLFYDAHRGKDGHQASDFMSLYASGWMLLNRGLIYTDPAPEEMPVPYYNGVARYLPVFMAAICVPTNIFTPWTAYWIYIGFLEILLMINIFLSRRMAVRGPPYGRLFVTVMWLIYTPYFCELYMGQITFFCATLVFWMLCLRGKRPFAEGLIWNASMAVKMLPVLFVPAFLKQRRYKTLLFTFLFFFVSSWLLFSAYSKSRKEDIRADRLIPYAGDGIYWLFESFGVENKMPHVKVKEDILMIYSKLFQNVAVTDFPGSPGFLPMVYQLLSSMLPETKDGKKNISRETFTTKSAGKSPGKRRLKLKGAEKSRALSLTKFIASLVLLLMLYTTFFGRGDFTDHLLLWMSGLFLAVFTTWEHHYVFLLPVAVLLYLRTGSRLVLFIFFLLALPTPFIFYQTKAIDSWLYYASKGIPAFLMFLLVLRENFREGSGPSRPAHRAISRKS